MSGPFEAFARSAARAKWAGERVRNGHGIDDMFPEVAADEDLTGDERYTTRETIAWAQKEIGIDAFDLDVAACEESHHAPTWYSKEDNGLIQPWFGRVWNNPPYSNIAPWVTRAWEAIRGADPLNHADLIAMLIPATRTEQAWWQWMVEPHRDRGGELSTRFLPGRTSFARPGSGGLRPGRRAVWLRVADLAAPVIAALFVQRNGCYFGLDGVDPWDEARDARLYAGPHRVIAHPPCQRWGMLAKVVEARWGHRVGDDDGCFESALASVRKWGGVLEHPAYTTAWAAFGLARPPPRGGWVLGLCGGWSAHVEQGHYGHKARKATWLYARVDAPPDLKWGRSAAMFNVRSWRRADGTRAPEMPKRERSTTPAPFREVLLSIARSA